MIASLEQIATSIAEDALTLAQWVIDKKEAGEHKVSEDLEYIINQSNNVIIELLFNDYIEKGRKPGLKMPPISALRDWALRKNISVDNNTLYAIAKAISRDGIAPRPIMDLLIVELEKAFEKEWSVDLFDFIVLQIQDLFDE